MKTKIAEYWSKHPPGYDKASYFDVIEARRINEPYVQPLLHKIVQYGGKVLEVGCGLGADTCWLAEHGCNITAVDLSQSNVNRVKKILRDVKILCADAEELPFANETFDVYYSFGCLHHTPRTQKAIEEAYRVLKPQGRFIIMLYHKGYAWWYLRLSGKSTNEYDHTPLSKMYSKKELYQLFGDFNDVRISMTTFRGSNNVWRILEANKFLMDRFGQFAIVTGIKSERTPLAQMR